MPYSQPKASVYPPMGLALGSVAVFIHVRLSYTPGVARVEGGRPDVAGVVSDERGRQVSLLIIKGYRGRRDINDG